MDVLLDKKLKSEQRYEFLEKLAAKTGKIQKSHSGQKKLETIKLNIIILKNTIKFVENIQDLSETPGMLKQLLQQLPQGGYTAISSRSFGFDFNSKELFIRTSLHEALTSCDVSYQYLLDTKITDVNLPLMRQKLESFEKEHQRLKEFFETEYKKSLDANERLLLNDITIGDLIAD